MLISLQTFVFITETLVSMGTGEDLPTSWSTLFAPVASEQHKLKTLQACVKWERQLASRSIICTSEQHKLYTSCKHLDGRGSACFQENLMRSCHFWMPARVPKDSRRTFQRNSWA